MSWRHAVAIVLTLQASGALGLDASLVRCRKYLAAGSHALALSTLNQEIGCHKQRMLGKLASDVDCTDVDDPAFPASKRNRIQSKASRLVSRVGSYCGSLSPAALGVAGCASPCDAQVPSLSTLEDVAQCLACLAQHHATLAVGAAYGVMPPVTLVRNSIWKCQNTYVGTAMTAYVRTRTGRQRVCQYREDRGDIPATDCKTADLNGAVATAAGRLQAQVARCMELDVAALSSCSISLAGEQSCVQMTSESMTDTLFDLIYPEPPPTPTPSATSTRTPTRTPSITRTPTATATPAPTLACPSENFLDVSLAPGPGGSYPMPSLTVSCTASTVNVRSNGIPHYTFVQTTPNALQAQNLNFNFPRQPAVAAQTSNVPLLGNIGVAINGVPLYGPNEAQTPDPYGDPVANAILDECLGHTGFGGAYHYHAALVKCLSASGLVAQPWNNPDPPPDQPSPIIAYAFDGFPIYGPYECTDASCSGVHELLSSWDNVGYSAGTVGCTSSAACGSTRTCAAVMINGAPQTACVPKTCSWTNNQYVAKSGNSYLDRCNGHYGPNGDYHYHATLTFPYLLGCYRGTPTSNGGTGSPPGGSCS
jgi:hypothetical protein